jgi:hypothetical protein
MLLLAHAYRSATRNGSSVCLIHATQADVSFSALAFRKRSGNREARMLVATAEEVVEGTLVVMASSSETTELVIPRVGMKQLGCARCQLHGPRVIEGSCSSSSFGQ